MRREEEKEGERNQDDVGRRTRNIGADAPLLDGAARASGGVTFVEDVRLPGMLQGKFLRSPHAHARVVSIDTSAALRVPGVKAIITGRDTPRRYGVLPVGHDETALATDKVRYAGQEVAAVAATSAEAAERAVEQLQVAYEILPPYLDLDTALKVDAEPIHANRPRNVEKSYHHVFGDPAAEFDAADVIVEDTFFHPRVTHAALEPHGTVARYEDGNRYTLWTSTQTARHVQRGVARALEIAEPSIRVIPCAVGGGFGGKSETFPADVAAALLARRTGRPVRFILDRHEVFLLHRGRPESRIHMRVGFSKEGRVRAVECETFQDGGAYCSYGVVTILYSGALLCALYAVDNLRFDGYRVLTNKPACGPMRGHGTIAARHAFESLLDRGAVALGMDPLELRRRNFLTAGSRTINDLRVTSYGLPECIEVVERASKWKDRRGRLPYGRGIGFGASHYVSGASNAIVRGSQPHSTVKLETDRDGKLTLFVGTTELGQGSDTLLAMITAEALALRCDDIRVISGDTLLTPVDLGTYASRVTFMAGNAALEAANRMRERLVLAAAKALGVPTNELRLERGRIVGWQDGARSLSFRDAVRLAVSADGPLVTTGSYSPPRAAKGGTFRGAGVGPGVAYSYAAQVVEVEVDVESGEVSIVKVWAAHDCGKAINPLAVEGQVRGSIWMGIGQALWEEQHFSPQGLSFNPGLLEYKMPTSVDSPDIEIHLVESSDPEGPFGAKEAGEGSLAAILPALTNAIHDAIGVWVTELPLSPERILRALRNPATSGCGRPAASPQRRGAPVSDVSG